MRVVLSVIAGLAVLGPCVFVVCSAGALILRWLMPDSGQTYWWSFPTWMALFACVLVPSFVGALAASFGVSHWTFGAMK